MVAAGCVVVLTDVTLVAGQADHGGGRHQEVRARGQQLGHLSVR